jgi:hypothetical protein
MAEPERPKLAYRSRLLALLLVVAAIGAPAVVLRVLCVGHSCDEEADASSEVPFCSLSADIRGPVVNGFRKGRSPEVLAVTGKTRVYDKVPMHTFDETDSWPSTRDSQALEVPIVFTGPGIPTRDLPEGTGLDDIAPTLAESIDLRRRFPEVRSGTAVPGLRPEQSPTLLVVVAMKGLRSANVFEAGSTLIPLFEDGASTGEGTVGSLPIDTTAAVTTIGTGGLPSQHGMVGSLVRNDDGELVPAWGKGSPVSVIAALGDDLDELLQQKPLIGVAGTEVSDQGLIGGNWYVDVDRDEVSISDDPVAAAREILAKGFGQDEVPDLLGVALEGSPGSMDSDIADLIDAADEASGGRYVAALAGTGSPHPSPADGVTMDQVVREIEREIAGPTSLIETPASGGLFLDQNALVETGLAEDAVIGPLKEITDSGDPLIVDAFPAIAVSFSKYC